MVAIIYDRKEAICVKTLKFVFTIIPFIWSIGMIPFVNRANPHILGLPFLAAWLSGGIIVAFVCLGILYHLDKDKEEA